MGMPYDSPHNDKSKSHDESWILGAGLWVLISNGQVERNDMQKSKR